MNQRQVFLGGLAALILGSGGCGSTLKEIRVDQDHDGKAELVELYLNNQLVKETYFIGSDGKPDAIFYYSPETGKQERALIRYH